MPDSSQTALDADLIEIAAFREIVAAAPAPVAQATGLQWLEIAGTSAVIAPSIPDPTFNRVMGLGLQRPASPSDLDAVVQACRSITARPYWIHLHPLARPATLASWLEQRDFGLAKRRSWAKVARGGEAAPEFDTSLNIRLATPEDFIPAADAARTAFGMPPAMTSWLAAVYARPGWHVVVALDAGRIVGSGALYVEDRIGWLGIGGVLAESRGRNAHRALMALRIRLALEMSCRLIVTETGEPVGDESNPSLANMVRCGFTQVASRLNYASLAPAPLT